MTSSQHFTRNTPSTEPQDATTHPFALTLLTATKGNASKRLVADAHDNPVKDPEHRLGISAGRVEHVQVTGLLGLRDLLARVQHNQALVHGIPKGSTPGDVLKLVTAEKFTGAPGTVARTLDCFAYPPTRLLMFDVDPAAEAPVTVASPEDLVTRLAEVWPQFAAIGWLATVSTSSAIKHKDTGAWLRPPEGMHVYVLACGDVVRFRELAKACLWRAGTGYVKLASENKHTGVRAMLERCLVDLTVFSPERLDYVSGARIAKSLPFYQDRPAPTLHPGAVLDLDALPDATPAETAQAEARIAEAKARLAPAQRQYIREHVLSADAEADAEAVERAIDARLDQAERGELDLDQVLYFDNGKSVTAREVSKAFDGRRLRDPMEPDYGPSQAVFHWRKGAWCIVSWSHGVKKVYRLAGSRTTQHTDTRPAPIAANGSTPTADTRQTRTDDTRLPYSDYTNACALVREYGQDLRYCYPWKSWLTWNGAQWEVDSNGAVMRYAKATVKRLARRVEALDDTQAVKALLSHVKSSLSTAKLKALVESAQSEDGIPVQPEDLDSHHWLLNCHNGTLDLRTGTLRPHRRGDLLTKVVPVSYDAHATCPTWERVLWRIMGGTSRDEDTEDMSQSELEARQVADDKARRLIAFLQRACGYALTGDTREQALFILHGTGANGKSTFLEVLQALLADYGQATPSATLLVRDRHDGIPNDVARLRGARLVTAVEVGEGKRLNEELIKRLTGGDTMTARFLFAEFFDFKPVFKLFLAANHLPTIRGTDHAIWRRVQLVPFAVTIPDEEQDKALLAKLKAELSGILAWCVCGCLDWQRDGLRPPEDVTAATDNYRKSMDTLERFIDECCVKGPQCRVKAGVFYEAYKRWCEDTGEAYVMSLKAVGARLDVLGYEKETSNYVIRRGIDLCAREDKQARRDHDEHQ